MHFVSRLLSAVFVLSLLVPSPSQAMEPEEPAPHGGRPERSALAAASPTLDSEEDNPDQTSAAAAGAPASKEVLPPHAQRFVVLCCKYMKQCTKEPETIEIARALVQLQKCYPHAARRVANEEPSSPSIDDFWDGKLKAKLKRNNSPLSVKDAQIQLQQLVQKAKELREDKRQTPKRKRPLNASLRKARLEVQYARIWSEACSEDQAVRGALNNLLDQFSPDECILHLHLNGAMPPDDLDHEFCIAKARDIGLFYMQTLMRQLN